MKTILYLLLTALIVHGCYRAGTAAWRYYEFKDAVEQEARFGGNETVATLRARILKIAEEHGIALLPADLDVHKEGNETTVAALYGEQIELVPRLYTREHLFEFELNVHPVRPLTLDDVK